MEHINKAFKKEEGIIKYNLNRAKRDLRTTRGLLYHKLGETDKGINDLQEALKLNPQNSFAFYNLGIIYSETGNREKACEYISKAGDLGYEKEFDRYDYDYYKKTACSEENLDKPIFNFCDSNYIDLNLKHSTVKIENYPISNFNYELCTFKNNIISRGSALNGVVHADFLSPGLYTLKITNKEQPLVFKLIKF